MGTVLVAPITLSSASVNADTVPAGTQPTQTEWVANSVSTVRAEMQAQGLNLSHVQGKYVVRKGDTLLAISQVANEIAKVNHITNLNLIYVGQVLYLGSNGVVKAQSASANNEVANNAGTGVAANVMGNGGNTTGTSIATPANNGIYRGFTGNGTVAAHPSRTAEQARNAAKVGMSTNTSAKSHTAATKTDTSVKHDAPAKTASSAKVDTSTSVASSTASSASHVSSSTTSKVDTSTKAPTTSSSASSSSKAPVASSTASSQTQSSQKPATSTTSSSASSTQNVPAE